MSLDGNGRYTYLSPREGAQLAVAECCRNLSVVGAVPVAATNCLNFGNPERPEIMAQLVEAIEGMADACRFFETPITGGNVSLYNETLGEGIYPTPVAGVVGILDDMADAMTFHFRQPGRQIWLLSGSGQKNEAAEAELGSSEYARHVLEEIWGQPPALDLKREAALQKCLQELISSHLIESAHDCSDGGTAVALAEAAFVSGVGAEIDLSSNGSFPEAILFGEEASRVVISCDPKNREHIQQV